MLTKFGAVRTRNAKMEMVYCLPAELGVPTATSPLKTRCWILITMIRLWLSVPAGAAQLIARLLENRRGHSRQYRAG